MNFHPAFFLAEVFDLEASIPPSGNARFGFVAEETCWWPWKVCFEATLVTLKPYGHDSRSSCRTVTPHCQVIFSRVYPTFFVKVHLHVWCNGAFCCQNMWPENTQIFKNVVWSSFRSWVIRWQICKDQSGIFINHYFKSYRLNHKLIYKRTHNVFLTRWLQISLILLKLLDSYVS